MVCMVANSHSFILEVARLTRRFSSMSLANVLSSVIEGTLSPNSDTMSLDNSG